jgi:hypothetical protein
MRPDYTRHQHAPLDHFAFRGWRQAMNLLGITVPTASGMVPPPEEGDGPIPPAAELEALAEAARRDLDHWALEWLAFARAYKLPGRHGIRVEKPGGGTLAITWPDRLPGLRTWAGQQTLHGLWEARRASLVPKKKSGLPSCPDGPGGLWAFRAACGGASGLDSDSTDAIDLGFSPDAAGIDVMWRPAVEMLAVVGLEGARLAVQASSPWLEYRAGGKRWRFQRLKRTKYLGRLSMAEQAGGRAAGAGHRVAWKGEGR